VILRGDRATLASVARIMQDYAEIFTLDNTGDPESAAEGRACGRAAAKIHAALRKEVA